MAATTSPPEARSLSVINDLAANPPQYPHHTQVREALTLYLSRVPGTSDVILSTFKPRVKNVTADDVANALYYVHLADPSDELLAASRNTPRPRASTESMGSTIARKPLPPGARVANHKDHAPETHPPPPLPPPHTQPFARPWTSAALAPPIDLRPGPVRYPVEGYRQNPMFSRRSVSPVSARDSPPDPLYKSPKGTSITRKPVGFSPEAERSRPSTPPLGFVRPTPTSPGGLEQAPGPTRSPIRGFLRALQRSPLSSPAKDATAPPYPLPESDPESIPERLVSPTKPGIQPSFVPFSLTLIRRDPTSRKQWNVGTITSCSTNIPTPDAADGDLDPNFMGTPHAQPITVHLETSGYAKYRWLPTRAAIGASRPHSASSATVLLRDLQEPRMDSGRNHAAALLDNAYMYEEGFTRQVVMEYGKNLATSILDILRQRNAKSSSGDSDDPTREELLPPQLPRTRQGSLASVASMDSSYGPQGQEGIGSQPVITKPAPGQKAKGYVFMSPWGSPCEFRTGNNGRSLKCCHVLDAQGPALDPMGMIQNIRDGNGLGRSRGRSLSVHPNARVKPVSELRFDLPGADLFRSVREGDGKPVQQLQAAFSKLLHMEPQGNDKDQDKDGAVGLDLVLGREKAGGGARGTRAKLGKLIIHDEGLNMLDLVVAANMGVWWTTWERLF